MDKLTLLAQDEIKTIKLQKLSQKGLLGSCPILIISGLGTALHSLSLGAAQNDRCINGDLNLREKIKKIMNSWPLRKYLELKIAIHLVQG